MVMLTNDELGRDLEGSNCECNMVLSQHLPEGTEANHKTEFRIANDLTRI
jgi:hypothetical protein